jgi:hypothetical protein
MNLHRAFPKIQVTGNLLVCFSLPEGLDDVDLPLSQYPAELRTVFTVLQKLG